MVRVTAKFSFNHDRVRARRGDVIELTDRAAADLARRGLVEYDGAPPEQRGPLAGGTAQPSSASPAVHPSPTTTSILSAAGEALASKPRRGRKPKAAVS